MRCSGAAQTELYRYVDGALVGKGYEVLNEQGWVLPAPARAERARLSAQEERALLDVKLLRLYSRVADVERAWLRKLSERDGLIAIAEANLQVLLVRR